jgi:DNA-binding transcriptional LysR family regulator
MELRQLRYFVAVAEERHFGRAADRVCIAQSPLSRQIRSLERELGVALLERSTRRVDLTPAGEVLLARGRDILRDIDLASSIAAMTAGEPAPVRLGCAPCVGSALAGHALRLIRHDTDAPVVELHAHLTVPVLLASTASGDIDMAIAGGLDAFAAAAAVHARWLFTDQIAAVVPAGGQRFAAAARVRLADLRHEPFVCFPDDSGAGDAGSLRRWCARAGFEPAIVQTAPELDVLLGLVAGGVGCTLLPRAACGTPADGAAVRSLAEPLAVQYTLALPGTAARPSVLRIAARLHREFSSPRLTAPAT